MPTKKTITQTVQPDPQTMRMRELAWQYGLRGLGVPMTSSPSSASGPAAKGMPGMSGLAAPSSFWGRVGAAQASQLGGQPTVPGPGEPLFPNDQFVRTADVDPRFDLAAGNMQTLANLGLGAAQQYMDPTQRAAMIQSFMDPYQSQVVDALRGEMDATRARTLSSIKAGATAAGAYGGSRHGVAEGQALGELGRAENSQIANILSQGYGQALGAASALGTAGMNLGLAGSGQLASMGDLYRQVQQQRYDEDLRRLGIMTGLISGVPTGSSSSMPVYNNPLGAAAGGAAAGGAIGGPLGAGIGAGVGFFGSFL